MNTSSNAGLYKADPQIDLNFFELIIPQVAKVQKHNYTSKEELNRMRDDNPDYFFQRDGNQIYSWPTTKEPSILDENGEDEIIKFSEKNNIFAKIIQIAFEKFLVARGLKISRNKLFLPEFVKEKNIVSDIPGIALYQKMKIQTEILNFENQVKIGLVIDFSVRVEFTCTVQEVISKGIDPRGMLVKTESAFGKIKEVSNQKLILDSGEEAETEKAIPLGTRENQLHYLTSIGKRDELQRYIDNESTPTVIYKKIQDFYGYIKKFKHLIFIGADLNIIDILNFAVSGTAKGLKKDILHRPIHYFGNSHPEQQRYPSRDLPILGTFSNLTKHIKLLVLAPEEHKGSMEVFLKKFESNIKSLFGFEKVELDDRYFKKSTTPLKGFESLIYQENIKLSEYNAALILISESYKSLPVTENPYYVLKATLMGEKVPSQEVEIETIKQMNGANESFILNNISLAIYGKIGGTPWAVEKIDPLRKEFIIGVGGSEIKESDQKVKKIIGFATVFDFTGKYVVGECSTVATSDDYKNVLKDYLITLITNLINSENISHDKEIRLIFHLFKPAGKFNEIWAIQEAISQFGNYNIEFAILHLNEGHNFRVFAQKGTILPQRGLLIELSANKKLLCFASKSFDRELKGNPAPLLVILDERSSFKDLDYLIKQVFYFSFLSCKSFMPSKTPITILYPSLLAFLTGTLKEIPGWNYRKLAVVKEQLWFI